METQSKRADMRCYKLTKYAFTKNITCSNSKECSDLIISKLEILLGGRIHVETEAEQPEGHISISHEQGNHKIWVFLYDTDGEHEGETKGATIMTPSNRVKAWSRAKPNIAAMIAAL